MKDLKGMRQYLSIKDQPKFISNNETFNEEEFAELLDIYKTYNKAEFKKCFENVEDKSCYKVEFKCCKCNSINIMEFAKNGLFNFIADYTKNKYICKNCRKEEELQQNKRYNEFRQQREDILYNELLNPNCYFTDKNVYNNLNFIKNMICNVDKEKLQEYIKELGYNEYLQTPLWKGVAKYKKLKQNRCQLCGCEQNLNVHHSKYDNIGFEAFNLNDLIVLCQDCHNKFHKEK